MFYIIIAVTIFVSDSILKYRIEKNTNSDKKKEIFNNKIIIKKYHNSGAMLELLASKPHTVAMVSLAFAAFMTGVFAATFGTKGKPLLKTGLALILGGAYSNTYDRLSKKYVVDYISFKVNSKYKFINRFQNVIFNISDFGIMIGAVFLVLNEIIKAE